MVSRSFSVTLGSKSIITGLLRLYMEKYGFIKKGAWVRFTLPVSDETKTGKVDHVFTDAIIRDDTRVRVHVYEQGQTHIYNRYADELSPAEEPV